MVKGKFGKPSPNKGWGCREVGSIPNRGGNVRTHGGGVAIISALPRVERNARIAPFTQIPGL